MTQGYIAVKGMACQHCVDRVMRAIEELDGVEDAVVFLEIGKAEVKFLVACHSECGEPGSVLNASDDT